MDETPCDVIVCKDLINVLHQVLYIIIYNVIICYFNNIYNSISINTDILFLLIKHLLFISLKVFLFYVGLPKQWNIKN